MRLPVASKHGKGRSRQLTPERLINVFAEAAPSGSKSELVLRGIPGLLDFSNPDTARIRGIHTTLADGRLYTVVGTALYYVDSAGTATSLGTIAGSGRVGMADNGEQLCIVAGAIGYIYTVGDGLSQITDADFGGASDVAFMDGFFLFTSIGSGRKDRFFVSNALDGTDFDALDFATAERFPDSLKRIFPDHSELLLFGSRTIEVWFNSGAAFPFAPAQGSAIEQGLGAKYSIAKVDEAVLWLDDEGIVRRLNGLTPVRISTHTEEYAIKQGDWENATAWSYVDEGHSFYVLTIPAASLEQTAATIVYDAATKLWHERQSYEADSYSQNFYARAYGKHIVGNGANGKLYEMSLDYLDDAGNAIIADITFPQIQSDGNRFIVHKFQLDMDMGHDLQIGGGQTIYTDLQNLYTDSVFGADGISVDIASGAGTNRKVIIVVNNVEFNMIGPPAIDGIEMTEVVESGFEGYATTIFEISDDDLPATAGTYAITGTDAEGDIGLSVLYAEGFTQSVASDSGDDESTTGSTSVALTPNTSNYFVLSGTGIIDELTSISAGSGQTTILASTQQTINETPYTFMATYSYSEASTHSYTMSNPENDSIYTAAASFEVTGGSTGSPSVTKTPQVMLDISGNTRTFDMTQPWRSAGRVGEYDNRVIWRRLGQHRSFTPRIRISDAIPRAIYAAYVEIERCR